MASATVLSKPLPQFDLPKFFMFHHPILHHSPVGLCMNLFLTVPLRCEDPPNNVFHFSYPSRRAFSMSLMPMTSPELLGVAASSSGSASGQAPSDQHHEHEQHRHSVISQVLQYKLCPIYNTTILQLTAIQPTYMYKLPTLYGWLYSTSCTVQHIRSIYYGKPFPWFSMSSTIYNKP